MKYLSFCEMKLGGGRETSSWKGWTWLASVSLADVGRLMRHRTFPGRHTARQALLQV